MPSSPGTAGGEGRDFRRRTRFSLSERIYTMNEVRPGAPTGENHPGSSNRTSLSGCPHMAAAATQEHHPNADTETGPPPTEQLKPIEEMPGPAPAPIIGWRGSLLKYLRNPIGYMRDLRTNHGEVARLVSCPNSPIVCRPTHENTSTVFVLGSEGARDVLTASDTFIGGEFRAPKGFEWMNGSIVAEVGERRQKRRGTMSPAFTHDHLQLYVPEVVQQTRLLLEGWTKGGTFDLAGDVYDLASGIASTCFFGQEPSQGQANLAYTVRKFGEQLISPLAAIPLNVPGTPYHRLRRHGLSAYEQLLNEIAKKRASDDMGKDILGMMISSQDEQRLELEEDELIGDAVAIFLAGHDVPANAITFCLLLLSQHPEVLEELLHELDREVAGEVPSYQQLWRLPVLDRVIKESLRVLGPTLLVLRQAGSTGSIQGYEIPAGTEVLVSPYLIHTDPEIWEEPHRYRPDRWQSRRPSAFEYLPFSYGARRCLGASFAELMLKIVISMVVRKVRLKPQSAVDFFCTFVISPKSAIEVEVTPQDRKLEESRVKMKGQITDLVDFS